MSDGRAPLNPSNHLILTIKVVEKSKSQILISIPQNQDYRHHTYHEERLPFIVKLEPSRVHYNPKED